MRVLAVASCALFLAALSCSEDDDGSRPSSGGAAGSGAASGSGGGVAESGGSPGDAATDAPLCPAAPVSHTLTPLGATEGVLNPARGFHDFVDLLSNDDFSGVRAAGRSVAYAGVSLLPYLNAPLDAGFLAKLDAGLSRVRDAKIKVVLRFMYRDDFADPNDAPLSRILEHIAALAPVVGKHLDVVLVLEAGFIGPWGEWHSSTNGLDADAAAQKAILDALLALMPADGFVLVRRWSFKQGYAGGPVSEAQAFGGTPTARVGHHNDCFLSSPDDVGTYPAGQVDAWKALLGEDTRFVPMGGETCADFSARTTCSVAVPEMQALHWSFLNELYHPAVISRWKTEGCYEEISARLGYRLVVEEATFPDQAEPGCGLGLSVTLRNDGFAPPWDRKELLVVLDGPTRVEQPFAFDARRLGPGKHTLQTVVPLPSDLPAGKYRLALWLPDSAPTLRAIPEYAVRFANVSVWLGTSGINVLSDSLEVTP